MNLQTRHRDAMIRGMDSSTPFSHGLWPVARMLGACRWVELPHVFRPGQSRYPGDPDQVTETYATVDSDGFHIDRFSFISQWSTHIDAPGHRISGGTTLADIAPEKLFLPLTVIDVSPKVADNPDYLADTADITAHEALHGPIPEGSFVAVASNWSARWEDPRAYLGTDTQGVHHFPGISARAVEYLANKRRIAVLGHESPATDPAYLSCDRAGYPAHTRAAEAGIPLVEMMTNLDQVPATGAVASIGFPVPAGATGFPVRVLAALPG